MIDLVRSSHLAAARGRDGDRGDAGDGEEEQGDVALHAARCQHSTRLDTTKGNRGASNVAAMAALSGAFDVSFTVGGFVHAYSMAERSTNRREEVAPTGAPLACFFS